MNGGCAVSCSVDCDVRLWDISEGTCLRVLRQPLPVRCVRFCEVIAPHRAPQRYIVSGSRDGVVRVCSAAAAGAFTAVALEGHKDMVMCLAAAGRCGLIASGSGDRTVRLWDCGGAQPRALQTLRGHMRTVSSVCVAEAGDDVIMTPSWRAL